MMKVLHITTNYPTPEYPIFGIFVKEQVDSLQKLGLNCDVFYCDGQGKGFKKYITYIPKLFRKIHRGKYDIIHCHHALSAVLLYLTGIPLFCRKNIILSYQNDPINEWGDKWFWRFYTKFKAFIVKNPSEYLKFPKVNYLPNGCNQDFFRPKDKGECRKILGWEVDKIYIIWMDSNKGVRTQKRRDRFDTTLDLLRGKYGYQNIEPVIMRNVPREEMPDYLNACDLHLVSSDFEGSPNSVKECMCCNTPVVSTPVGNVKEMIGDIPGCVVTNEFTPEALAEGCDMVLKNKEKFNGRELFLAKGYGMATVAEKLKGIYEQILNK
jgi:teichuronic acid biosynthesis glycosyltransferase TuaC